MDYNQADDRHQSRCKPDAGGVQPRCVEHRLEYKSSMDGGDYYRCTNEMCGEVVFQAVDGARG